MAQLKELNHYSIATKCRKFMANFHSGEGFYLQILPDDPMPFSQVVETQKGDIKRYKTTDALHADCRRIAGDLYTLYIDHSDDAEFD